MSLLPVFQLRVIRSVTGQYPSMASRILSTAGAVSVATGTSGCRSSSWDGVEGDATATSATFLGSDGGGTSLSPVAAGVVVAAVAVFVGVLFATTAGGCWGFASATASVRDSRFPSAAYWASMRLMFARYFRP